MGPMVLSGDANGPFLSHFPDWRPSSSLQVCPPSRQKKELESEEHFRHLLKMITGLSVFYWVLDGSNEAKRRFSPFDNFSFGKDAPFAFPKRLFKSYFLFDAPFK